MSRPVYQNRDLDLHRQAQIDGIAAVVSTYERHGWGSITRATLFIPPEWPGEYTLSCSAPHYMNLQVWPPRDQLESFRDRDDGILPERDFVLIHLAFEEVPFNLHTRLFVSPAMPTQAVKDHFQLRLDTHFEPPLKGFHESDEPAPEHTEAETE